MHNSSKTSLLVSMEPSTTIASDLVMWVLLHKNASHETRPNIVSVPETDQEAHCGMHPYFMSEMHNEASLWTLCQAEQLWDKGESYHLETRQLLAMHAA
eukprot:2832539-Amphidinium_carterae.1